MSELIRKGFLWVESWQGERVQITDRFCLEYQHGDQLYTLETEPSFAARPLYARTLRLAAVAEPLATEERERVLQRIISLLRFSEDPFTVVN